MFSVILKHKAESRRLSQVKKNKPQINVEPKKIVVVVSSVNEEYQNKIIKGIRKFTREHNFIVTIFTAFGGIVNIQSHENGENTIYQLIDFDKYDGAILMTNTIISDDVTYDILNLAKNSSIPVVGIDYENNDFYSVITDNFDAQAEVIEHLINEHGMKRINYVSGPATNPDSIQRLHAYKSVLEKHGITFDPKRVYEGHFLEFDGEPAVSAFLESEPELPDAIVCGNDEMAMGVIRALESRGFNVPKDVAVTGYDNIYKAKQYFPAITTVGRPLFETGYKAAEIIYRVLNDEDVEQITVMKTSLVCGDSCGCRAFSSEEEIEKYKIKTYNIIDSYMKGIPIVNKMNIFFTECGEFDDFIDCMKQAINIIKCDSFALCVCDQWLTSCYQTDKSVSENTPVISSYTDNMRILLSYNDGVFKTGENVAVSRLIPDTIHQKSGDIFFFSPIHYQDMCIGYCCIKNSDYPLDSALFYTWLLNIDSALEHMHQKTKLNAAFNRLSGLYGLDQLTNIYNRVGFYQIAQKKFDMCVQFHRKAMIMFIDMDGMKKINDTYGHNEGDYALIALAAAIKKACNENQICARFGGDEFVVFQSGCGELCGEELSCRIQEMIYEHNRTFGKPYKIEASIGYYIIKPTAKTQLSKMIEIADEKMYEEKRMKHSER